MFWSTWFRRSHPFAVLVLVGVVALIGTVQLACNGGQTSGPSATNDKASTDASETDPQADASPVRFVEVAAEVGLDFVHANGSRGEFEIFEVMGSGAALIDYDQDGDLDVFLVQGMPIAEVGNPEFRGQADRLYRNDLTNSNGVSTQRFVDVSEEAGIAGSAYGFGVAVGDANQDGWLDLYVSNLGPNTLWINQGDGTFVDGTAECGCDDAGMGTSVAFDDLDGDGLDDLFVANYVDYNLKSPRRCTNRLGKRDFCGPTVFEGVENALFLGQGEGKFATHRWPDGQSAYRSLGVLGMDLDGDHRPEILVANDSDPNELWVRGHDGSWSEQADYLGVAMSGDGIAEGSMGIAAGDYDSDQDVDFLLTHFAGETSTWYAKAGPGLFLDATNASGSGPATFPLTGFGTGLLDAQMDGELDLVVVNGRVCGSRVPAGMTIEGGLAEPNQFFLGREARFEDASGAVGLTSREPLVSRALALGDIDNDGDIDMLITNNDAAVELWRNESDRSQSWVGLAFTRGAMSEWATGARVLSADGVLRVSSRAGSYLASSDPRIVLPCRDGGFKGQVQWPDGSVQELTVQGCEQYHPVVHPRGADAP